ncbi:MAG: exodeoxyribonuclease V subunit beta, partial [Thalassolituus sp.]
DDLLRLLDNALRSERGDELAAQIRRLYPVAMIDEFQDTDPIQYRIFSRIYPAYTDLDSDTDTDTDTDIDKKPGHGLIMIGDPKQAIYAFRGADIFTYMQASKEIPPERRFTLDTNYRSDSRLIQATNNLWQNREAPFVFEDSIDFYPVNAGGQHDKKAPVWQSAIPTEALQLWISNEGAAGEEENKAAAMQRVAEECASQISSLMAGVAVYPAAAKKGSKKTRTAKGGQPVEAGDIAVLVYSRAQAKKIRDALTAQGIGSVFLTRDSVLDSNEAWDLLAMLEAIAHPGNEAAVRRAIATLTWGATADDLVAMQNDESRWEAQLAAMHEYHQIWQRRGIMAMLMQWLEDDERAVRLRKLDDGERVLTNILHLGEMLQAQSRKVRGHQALIRWFSERIDPDAGRGEEAQLRLETDDRLVNIVTIHKSKGLEYPFVFLPYLWADSAKPKNQSTETIYYNGREVVRDLAPDENAKKRQQEDVLAEQMRLLYVALTRAKFGCYIWLTNAMAGRGKAKKPVWLDSALGYLLNTESTAEINIAGMYSGELPEWTVAGQAELNVPPPPVAAATNQARWRDHWRVGSYSQLAAHSSHAAHNAEAASADLGHYFDWEAGVNAPAASGADSLPLALRFPKGANPGTCLHAIFEHWDFHDKDALIDVCEAQLKLYGLQDEPAQEVADWIESIVHQPLALYDTTLSLKDIEPAARLDEMEFYLPVGQLSASDIDALLGGDNRFSFEPLTGYLKGFIDLIFEWQGRYYVADYKSNHLGDEWQNYVPSALRESMKDHRYDLQSWIYMLALDQLLSRRLPDYQPQKHLGGSVYFYLRGMGNHFTAEGEHADPDAGVCFTPVNAVALRHWRKSILP